MRRIRCFCAELLTGLVLCTALAARAEQMDLSQRGELPPADFSDPAAPVVTAQNLLASERFWPYQTALVRDWQGDAGAPALPAGSLGVLIRVEPSVRARIDFGRDGIHAVPLDATDLLRRAEGVRRGEIEKRASNLVWSLGPRLLDGAAALPRPLRLETLAAYTRFLCVFADPGDPALVELAAALRSRLARPDLLTIFFPLGEHPDATVLARLHSLEWPAAYLADHLADAYARSLGDRRGPGPVIQLLSREGRLEFEGLWSPETRAGLGVLLAD